MVSNYNCLMAANVYKLSRITGYYMVFNVVSKIKYVSGREMFTSYHGFHSCQWLFQGFMVSIVMVSIFDGICLHASISKFHSLHGCSNLLKEIVSWYRHLVSGLVWIVLYCCLRAHYGYREIYQYWKFLQWLMVLNGFMVIMVMVYSRMVMEIILALMILNGIDFLHLGGHTPR